MARPMLLLSNTLRLLVLAPLLDFHFEMDLRGNRLRVCGVTAAP